ncbi:MAG TPA: hypothetical protein ENN19_06715 [Chloroflexi bacterium]|nr:hypothetical protein [Chloroflexota bacterium]
MALLQVEMRRLNAKFETLWTAWQEQQGFAFPSTTKDIKPIFDHFPMQLYEFFPHIPLRAARVVALASRAASTYMLLLQEEQVGTLPCSQVQAAYNWLQSFAQEQLAQVIPNHSPFWQQFSDGYHQCRQAFEQQRQSLTLPPKPYPPERFVEIVRGKTALAHVTTASLACMSNQEELSVTLIEAQRHLYAGLQLCQDVSSWKQDFVSGALSYPLIVLLTEKLSIAVADSQAGRQTQALEIGRRFYYTGLAKQTLETSSAHFRQAITAISNLSRTSWRIMLAGLLEQNEQLIHDIDKIVHGNLQRVREQPGFALALPPAQDRWQQLAWHGLHFIIHQWRLGFGEARHILMFPHSEGFSADHEYQYGDIFQRALITDILCDADVLLRHQLKPIIDYEIKYLVNARISDTEGWSYFPHLPELPPDVDDLAQIMQVLLRSGYRSTVVNYCEPPLSTLLNDNTHPDGSFETWILPAETNRTQKQRLQANFVHHAWGTGSDNGVIANLLYALACYDQHRFEKTIRHGINFLESQQQPDGSWMGSWYHGPYYGTYVCLRLLTAVSPDSPAIQPALGFLREAQLADGGWGEETSDPLNTALALLGLASTQNHVVKHSDFDQAERALTYLEKSRGDKVWPSCPFIRMELGRAQGQVHRVLSYGSQTMTTSFTLKAALAWHKLTTRFADDDRR